MSTGKENKKMNPDGDNLINKNSKANPDQARKFDKNDTQQSNVDPQKPQFERSNLQPNQEKRAGSGGAAMDPGRREDRQNNGNDNK
jgi:hypothetical protein